jgi:T5SS/PEP-CTERM-associated repeat protein
MAASTWQWTDADPGDFNSPSNWTLVGGSGNPQGVPEAGDTVRANDAVLDPSPDYTLDGNTFILTGTSEMSFVGTQAVGNGAGISYQNPTVDSTSVINNNQHTATTTTLNFAGYNVNNGTLISDGGQGSALTINVTQNAAAPGYLINYGDIQAAPHNTLYISAVGSSELFNAGLIYDNGGTVDINGGNGIAGGAAPMLGGVALIGDGGTIELNAGFPSGTAGGSPTFAFYDGDFGDTLTLLQPGQFGGRILDFQQGDTIDLGSGLVVGTIDVTADGRVLLENNRGAVIETLVLSSGAYNIGTFAFTSPAAGTLTADGFTLTTGSDGDTVLSTDVVNSVWNDGPGVWQTAADWSTGVVPGSTATAVIGDNLTADATATISPFVLTTGSSPVAVNSLTEINSSATLQITSDTTVGTSTNEYGISQIAGTIEVTGGNTLTSTYLQQLLPTADLQIDPGGTLAITGHSDLGFANNGAVVANGNAVGLIVQGTAIVNDGVINAGPVFSGNSVVSTGGFISIGQDGGATPATMTVENGATVTDTYGLLGSDATSFGSLTLTGAGTTWTDAGDPNDSSFPGGMIVGDNDQASNGPSPLPAGTAQLVVEQSATLNEATYAEIGATADSAGSATIETDGVWKIGTAGTGTLDVGVAGSGTLTVQSGGVLDLFGSGSFEIGQNTGGNGTVTVNDGTLNAGSDTIVLGNASDSSGALTVDNDGLLVAGSISVGVDGTGSLTIGSGGTVESTGVTVGSGSTINLSGGVLDPLIPVGVNGSGVIQGYGTLEGNVSLNSSSAEIISNGGTLEITGSVTGNGTLELAGGSAMRLDMAPSGAQIADFQPGTETLILAAPALNTVAFAGLTIGANDLIDFGNGIAINGISYASGTTGQDVTLDVTEGGTSGTIVLDNVTFTASATHFNIVTDPTTGLAAIEAAVPATPGFTAVTEDPSSGELGFGTEVTFTLAVNDPVTVNTASGAPTLSLNDNGTAIYDAAESTPTSLVFDYTLSGTDNANVTSLQATSVNLDGAVIQNAAGQNASLALTGLPQSGPQVSLPDLTGALASVPAGTYGPGEVMELLLQFNQPVTVTGDTVTLSLNDGGTATLDAANTAALDQFGLIAFDYKVADNAQDVAALAVTAINNSSTIEDNLGGPAQFLNGLPTFANVAIDPSAPHQDLMPCYCRGTLILTTDGEVPVEKLAVGDKVVTVSGEECPIKWIGHRLLDTRRHPDPTSVWPICVSAGAFGENKPSRDLWLSPGHNIAAEGVLMPIKVLQNGKTIVQQQRATVEYWHIELDQHDIILAEGLPAESYLDTGNRTGFVNGGAFIEAHPDFEPKHWAATCVPLVQEGPEVARTKTLLLEQLKALGYVTTSAADVHVIADGTRIDPIELGAKRFAFTLPATSSDIRLRSRTFIPAHTSAASTDTRSLGLCVKRLQIDGEEISLDDQIVLGDGWNDLERHPSVNDQRWTVGNTPLPANARLIVIDLAGPGHYWQEPKDNVVALFG